MTSVFKKLKSDKNIDLEMQGSLYKLTEFTMGLDSVILLYILGGGEQNSFCFSYQNQRKTLFGYIRNVTSDFFLILFLSFIKARSCAPHKSTC